MVYWDLLGALFFCGSKPLIYSKGILTIGLSTIAMVVTIIMVTSPYKPYQNRHYCRSGRIPSREAFFHRFGRSCLLVLGFFIATNGSIDGLTSYYNGIIGS